MPQGFDVESGAKLSQKLLGLVDWLDRKLKAVTIHQPLTASDICAECRKEKRIQIEGSDVRAMINYLRRSEKPIGSQADGYFYATEKQHLDDTILHLVDRIRGITMALRGLDAARAKLVKGQIDLF